jgi:hypothetical protein
VRWWEYLFRDPFSCGFAQNRAAPNIQSLSSLCRWILSQLSVVRVWFFSVCHHLPFEMLLFWGMLHYKNSTHTILCGLFFHCNPICWKFRILPCWACEIPMGRTTPDHDVGYISYIMLYPTLFPWYPHQLISNCSIKLYYGLLSRLLWGHLLRFAESLLFIPPVICIQHLGNSDGNNCSL